jgi:hypothetical protein
MSHKSGITHGFNDRKKNNRGESRRLRDLDLREENFLETLAPEDQMKSTGRGAYGNTEGLFRTSW